MYLCYRKMGRGEILEADRRCKYVLEAVGVNRQSCQEEGERS
jgi:hypothetical protein